MENHFLIYAQASINFPMLQEVTCYDYTHCCSDSVMRGDQFCSGRRAA